MYCAQASLLPLLLLLLLLCWLLLLPAFRGMLVIKNNLSKKFPSLALGPGGTSSTNDHEMYEQDLRVLGPALRHITTLYAASRASCASHRLPLRLIRFTDLTAPGWTPYEPERRQPRRPLRCQLETPYLKVKK
jgi:hypothetical protein